MTYNSRPDTEQHIETVRSFLDEVMGDLQYRAAMHDRSKLESPEVEVFDRVTPKLAALTYGSAEYKASLAEMGEGLQHHYAHNDHHPEHFPHGVADMDLLQVIELLADWKAATMRHEDGDLGRSITQNSERFAYGEEFERLLRNTAQRLGWL